MRKIYVIESVIRPGSFWADNHKEFKGWLYATKYSGDWVNEEVKRASKVEPCKITEVYDKQ